MSSIKNKTTDIDIDKKIKVEAITKTLCIFLASLTTSLLLPLFIAWVIPALKLKLTEVFFSFFTKGTLVTIVISHVITFIVAVYDDELMFFYLPYLRLRKRNKTINENEESNILFLMGAILLIIISVILYISFLSNPPAKDLVFPIIVSVIVFILDCIFNYMVILKKEKMKDTKYNLLRFSEELQQDQKDMVENKTMDSFSGGKL